MAAEVLERGGRGLALHGLALRRALLQAQHRPDSDALGPLAYAGHLTGDTRFMEIAEAALAATRPRRVGPTASRSPRR